MTDKLPPDPLTALMQGAAQMHELYLALRSAGFSEWQAMQLLCALIQKSTGEGS